MVEIRFWNEVFTALLIVVWFIPTSAVGELKFFRLRPALGNTVRLAIFFVGGAFLIWYLEAPLVGFSFAFLFIGVLHEWWSHHHTHIHSH